MEDDASVRKLVELIFNKQFKNISEATALDLSIAASLLTNDFLLRMQAVLNMKQMILNYAYREFIAKNSAITSYSYYLKLVMPSCLAEHESHRNIFESFISVCVLLKLFSDGTFKATGMDFGYLNTRLFIAFYDCVMKNTFRENGGFRVLVEYISSHCYLTWKWNWKDLSPEYLSHVMTREDIKMEIKKELTMNLVQRSEEDVKAIRAFGDTLAQTVLSTMSVNLSNLTNNIDVIKCSVAPGNEEIARDTERKRIIKTAARFVDLDETDQGCSSSNSDSKTKFTVNQNRDDKRYENTIQAVIRHNRLRSSGYGKSNNRIQKEADGIFEHLKDMIESLISVLDNYEKE
ncbi:unnamed protein product [Larinioides sclopetarius]|uniref:Uncharacterized protein n=1 Tax=Larinioides sclopetarius TaxID=280406 RepID=A0AAV2B2W3_9ARAC